MAWGRSRYRTALRRPTTRRPRAARRPVRLARVPVACRCARAHATSSAPEVQAGRAKLQWGEQDSNLRRHRQRVYSPSPLTTRTSPRAGAAAILERGSGSVCRRPTALRAARQPLRLRQHLELLQRVVLDLADALAGHAEGAADLLQSARLRARQAEAHLDHLALARGQRVQCRAHVLATQVLEREVERRIRLLVLH